MSSALLVTDVQAGIVNRLPEGMTEVLNDVRQAAAAARSAGIRVIYVRVGFRPNMPEISRQNRY